MPLCPRCGQDNPVVVALFGAPVAHEDDPEHAVRARFAVREAIEQLNEQDSWLDLKIRTLLS